MLTNEGRLFEVIHLEGDVEDEWLQLRRQGIGGSDVAPIMGLSPWVSPLEVWLDKTGRSEPRDLSSNEAVRMGTELEPTVLEMYRRRHPEYRARRVNAVLRSKARPWAQASLDGITHDPELGWGVLELKTSSREGDWAEGVPDHYMCQIVHYMSVTGYPFADIVALVGDRGLHYHEYRVSWDQEDMDAVTGAVDSFWHDFVEGNVMPSLVTGLQSETKALYEMYKRFDGDLTPDESDMADQYAREYLDHAQQEKEHKEAKTIAANGLRRIIGEYKGVIADEHVVTWVRNERRDSGLRVKVRE